MLWPQRRLWQQWYFIVICFASFSLQDKSQFHYIQSLCKNRFLQQVYRKIDGSILLSQNERNLDCVITFQTHSILQRFMLRYDYLHLDCNDHLYVYDGAHAVGTYKNDISCRETKQSVGAIFTRTNFVTLRYVTDEWGTNENGFKLVITAFKDSKHACKDFRCNSREFCISKDLICDGIKHCVDESDEMAETCPHNRTSTIYGIDSTMFSVTALAVSLVFLVILTLTIVFCCTSRRKQSKQHPLDTATDPHHHHHQTLMAMSQQQRSQQYSHTSNTYSRKLLSPCGTLRSSHYSLPSTPMPPNNQLADLGHLSTNSTLVRKMPILNEQTTTATGATAATTKTALNCHMNGNGCGAGGADVDDVDDDGIRSVLLDPDDRTDHTATTTATTPSTIVSGEQQNKLPKKDEWFV